MRLLALAMLVSCSGRLVGIDTDILVKNQPDRGGAATALVDLELVP